MKAGNLDTVVKKQTNKKRHTANLHDFMVFVCVSVCFLFVFLNYNFEVHPILDGKVAFAIVSPHTSAAFPVTPAAALQLPKFVMNLLYCQ